MTSLPSAPLLASRDRSHRCPGLIGFWLAPRIAALVSFRQDGADLGRYERQAVCRAARTSTRGDRRRVQPRREAHRHCISRQYGPDPGDLSLHSVAGVGRPPSRAASRPNSAKPSSCPPSRRRGASKWGSGLTTPPSGNSSSPTSAPARPCRCPRGRSASEVAADRFRSRFPELAYIRIRQILLINLK